MKINTTYIIIFLFNSILFSQMQDKMIDQKIQNYIKNNRDSYLRDISNNNQNAINLNSKSYLDSMNVYTQIKKNNTKDILKNYGYSFFNNPAKRIIWDNQPPPIDYVLGAGDEVIIEIWGETEFRANFIINQYGNIYIDKIGKVYVSGINIDELEQKLLKKFKKVYSSFLGSKPTAFLDVSIGKLKSINITILGEANMPGMYPIHPFSSIVSALLQVGGVLETGTLRNIQLIRNGKSFDQFDFYNYLIKGNLENNHRLNDGDVIYIPIRNSSITVKGQILKPAIYELLENETISDLINYSGGFKVDALPNILINRIINSSTAYPESPYNETIIINFFNNKEYSIKDGDDILVYKNQSALNQIYIYGQVKSPGEYAFSSKSEMKLLDILKTAGGINDSTFMKTVYIKEGEIIRNSPNTNFPEVIKFNLQSLINGDPRSNIKLRNWDIILIRENPKYKPPDKVTLSGEVSIPGVYTLQKRWEELDDVLARAGGFTEKAYIDGLKLYRSNKQVVLTDYNISLSDGDSIYVPQPAGIVEVIGAVNRPGFVQYERGKSFNEYINNAGGYSLDADKRNITIIYANGFVTTKSKIFNTKITNGSKIIVYQKPQEEPFNITEYATNLASIITSLTTIYLLLGQ